MGLVVFTHPNVQLQLDESSEEGADGVPILTVARLKKHIRAQPKGDALSADLRKRLAAFLHGEEIPQDDADE